MRRRNLARTFNIYADESCHLVNDRIEPMLLGCMWLEKDYVREVSASILELKRKHGLLGELKWTNVSARTLPLYIDLINFFFSRPELHFRVLIVAKKSDLDHKRYNQGSHDNFYYKMYFWLLTKIISPDAVYNIYLDVKDTRSRFKTRKLREVLCFDKYDFEGKVIKDLRSIRSHESNILQLADFFIGAVSYRERNLNTSQAKMAAIKAIEESIGHEINAGTSPFAENFNVFRWKPRALLL